MTDKEKLEKIKRLADAMYNKMAYLTSDTRPIRQAMEDYHNFIVHEYNKDEQVDKPLDFEQELYNYFGQVKDFTLGMRIAKRFYDMGKNNQEPESEDLEEAASRYAKEEYSRKNPATLPDRCRGCYAPLMYAFKAGAQWQEEKDKPVTKDLGDYINELSKQFPEVSFAKLSRIAVRVAKWQKQQNQSTIELAEDHAYFAGRTKTIDETKEALLSEVLPCFMHGGEADEVVAKLDEVLNQKK